MLLGTPSADHALCGKAALLSIESLCCDHLNAQGVSHGCTEWEGKMAFILGPLFSTVNVLGLRGSSPYKDIPYMMRDLSSQHTGCLDKVVRGIKNPWVCFLSHE